MAMSYKRDRKTERRGYIYYTMVLAYIHYTLYKALDNIRMNRIETEVVVSAMLSVISSTSGDEMREMAHIRTQTHVTTS